MSLIIPGLGYTVNPTSPYRGIDVNTGEVIGGSLQDFQQSIRDELEQNVADIDLLNQIVKFTPTTIEFDINKIGENIPIDQIPTEDSPFSRARYPEVLPSEGYLDVEAGTVDRIDFPVPKQFYREAIPEIQFGSNQKVYKRDVARFVSIVTNNPDDETEWYSILTTSPLWNRFKVDQRLDFEFTELDNA